jgi:mannose-6-phosphate isomerase-like protein (cupin superfamily)
MSAAPGDKSPAGFSYNTRLNILHRPLEVVDVPGLVDACTDRWYNQTLCQENEDEFFYVVSGQLLIDLEDRCIDLTPGKAVVIPKGVMHRPRAPERTVILMVERAGIVPTGTS